MINNTVTESKSETNVAQLRRLHYWLSYNRYTVFIYGGGFYLPWATIILPVLIVLAVVFAPYMLLVLYRSGRRGWLVFFAAIVGVPTVLAFLPIDDIVVSTILHFLPLLTFYFYCFVLRYAVAEWVSDASPVSALFINEQNRQNELNRQSGDWKG